MPSKAISNRRSLGRAGALPAGSFRRRREHLLPKIVLKQWGISGRRAGPRSRRGPARASAKRARLLLDALELGLQEGDLVLEGRFRAGRFRLRCRNVFLRPGHRVIGRLGRRLAFFPPVPPGPVGWPSRRPSAPFLRCCACRCCSFGRRGGRLRGVSSRGRPGRSRPRSSIRGPLSPPR